MNRYDDLFENYENYPCKKKDKVYIIEVPENKIVLKQGVSIDYDRLYKYLYSRGFSYVPELIGSKENSILLTYQEDINLDNSLKAKDLMRLVSLLHSKTSYHKEITKDIYQRVYEQIKDNLLFVEDYYQKLYDNFLVEEKIIPSHYLFLRNYSLLYRATIYCREKLDVWQGMVEEKTKKRVSLLHNNLRLEHLIKNENEYLISWDNYVIDSPVLDLYHFYQNEWEELPFLELIETYQEKYKLEDDELLLFCILISLPYKVEFGDDEYNNCQNVERLIAYLMKSSSVIVVSED